MVVDKPTDNLSVDLVYNLTDNPTDSFINNFAVGLTDDPVNILSRNLADNLTKSPQKMLLIILLKMLSLRLLVGSVSRVTVTSLQKRC